jgi:methionine-rich copper-binding protein CopC
VLATLSALLPTMVLLGVVVAGPAQAHASLLKEVPTDGSRLSSPPPEVSVTFTDDILVGTGQMQVLGPDGAQLPIEPVTDGATLSTPFPGSVGPGAYTVIWRVTSADGHPISGSYTFTVQTSATVQTAAPTASVGDSPSASPAAPSPAATTSLSPDLASVSSGTGTGTKILIAAAAAIAAGAGIAGLWTRGRRAGS